MTFPNESAESFEAALEETLDFKTPQKGDLLRGTIITVSGDDAYIAYGGPTEALIHADELDEGYTLGEEIEASVVSISGDQIRVSRKLLAKQASIYALKEAYEEGLVVEGKVTGRNKGGFDVKMGSVRAFCPLSQIDLGKIVDPDSYVGNTYDFKVLEISDDGRKLVISRAAVLKEEAAEKGKETLENLQIGMTVSGVVRNVVPFGAFVDIGGIEGLLHVSEISHHRIEDPKTVLSPGQEIDVVVTKIEENGKRISLSRKDLEPDPWISVPSRFNPGDKFTGTIARKTDFGLFVELEPGVDGLVHQSMLPHGTAPSDSEFQIGSQIEGWVKEVDANRRRISLALREISDGDPWEHVLTKYPMGRTLEGTVEKAVDFGVFVEVEAGLTGLVPVSELDLAPDQSPEGLFEPGAKLPVRVLSVDTERRRMSLTLAGGEEEGDVSDQIAETAPGKSAMALAMERAMSNGS